MIHDVIIIGGSYAGLSAALQLARARRPVLVIDAGQRRNRFASAAHGFLGQDGRDPGIIAEEARAQVRLYPTVSWHEGEALHAWPANGVFRVEGDGGVAFEGRRLVVATGVRDTLPDIPGLAERWGHHVFHCPYCHGYELQRGRIGVLAVSGFSLHQALMLPDWGPTTLFVNGAFEPDEAALAALHRRGVMVEPTPVARIAGDRADVVLADGRTVPCDGLFVMPRTEIGGTFSSDLGLALAEGPSGRYIETGETGETSVPGVFACGDAARAAGSVALAVAGGAMAGIGAHRSLMFAPH